MYIDPWNWKQSVLLIYLCCLAGSACSITNFKSRCPAHISGSPKVFLSSISVINEKNKTYLQILWKSTVKLYLTGILQIVMKKYWVISTLVAIPRQSKAYPYPENNKLVDINCFIWMLLRSHSFTLCVTTLIIH